MASAVLTAVCHEFREFFFGSCRRFILLGFLFFFLFTIGLSIGFIFVCKVIAFLAFLLYYICQISVLSCFFDLVWLFSKNIAVGMSYLQMKFRGILKNGFPVKCIDESPSGASAGTLLLHRVNGACCVSVCVLNTYVVIMAIAECEK